MDYKIKLNIASICYYEQLSKKSYSKFDVTDEDDILTLLYSIIIANNDVNDLYIDFKNVMLNNKKLFTQVFNKFKNEVAFIELFSDNTINEDTTKEITEVESDSSISVLIPLLVNDCGVNINYVMNNMQMFEVMLHVKHYESNYRSQLELSRLWTFLQMLPHCGNSLKSPEDIFKFNWEINSTNDEVELLSCDELSNILNNAPK